MKVLEESIESGKSRKEILQTGKKKYIRIASERGVEWRRHKTNHQVKQVEFDVLEKEYGNRFPPNFVPASSMKQIGNKTFVATWKVGKVPVIKDDKKRREIERQVVSMVGGGSKLSAVKYVKEQTGWGLKESKDYIEDFLDRARVATKW